MSFVCENIGRCSAEFIGLVGKGAAYGSKTMVYGLDQALDLTIKGIANTSGFINDHAPASIGSYGCTASAVSFGILGASIVAAGKLGVVAYDRAKDGKTKEAAKAALIATAVLAVAVFEGYRASGLFGTAPASANPPEQVAE